LTADEHPFDQTSAGRFNDSFFGNTVGMVAKSQEKLGAFRSEFDKKRDLRKHQIWIRAAEVYSGSVPAGATGFVLGLEDDKGVVVWVDSDGVGGLPRPLAHSPAGASGVRCDGTPPRSERGRSRAHPQQDR